MKKLLFVDDDDASRNLFKMAYGDNYKVYLANSAENAITTLEKEEISVIISDQKMPGKSGLEMFEILEVRETSKSIKILITGFHEIKTAIEAVNQGYIYKYITKPFNLEDLSEVLKQAFQQYDSNIKKKKLKQTINQENEIRNQQFAHQLHENIAQNIASVNFNINTLKSGDDIADEKLNHSDDILKKTVLEMKELSQEISPFSRDCRNLKEAVEFLKKKEKEIVVYANIPADANLIKEFELHLFRLIQYLLKQCKEQKRITSVSFDIYQSKNKNNIQLVFYNNREIYGRDFLDTIRIMIEPYAGELELISVSKHTTCSIFFRAINQW
jgi:response regulator RpfG family c-di-GMP phosphodiesterase